MILFAFFGFEALRAQSPLPLNDSYSQTLRYAQLKGQVSTRHSWMLRPVLPTGSEYDLLLRQMDSRRGFHWKLHDVRTTNIYNTEYPYGTNNEAVFSAKGWTTLWAARASFGYGPLHVQLDPTFIYAESVGFMQLPLDYQDFIYRFFYTYYFNVIDRPFRYRTSPYLRVIPGNSEAMLRFGPVSAGVSTANVWWGPGYRNSLLLSNNAEGFLHGTIRSHSPVKTPVGRFEFQGIWGRLEASGEEVVPPRRYRNGLPMPHIPKEEGIWRLFTGLMFTWQPEWTPGLSVGMARTVVANSEDVKKWHQVFSFLRSPFEEPPEEPGNVLAPDLQHLFDDKFALYIRYVFPSEHFEVYGEWGRNGRPESWADFFEFPEHGHGFILGLNKLVPLRPADTWLRLGAELTQLEKTNTARIRHYPTWYVHHHVRHGYTHRGQVLGAGIGPGSNAQYFGADFIKGNHRIGTFVERTIYNNDLHYILFTTTFFRHWADITFGFDGEYHFRNISVAGTLAFINTYNYLYIEDPRTIPGGSYIGKDVKNTHLQVSVRYRF